MHIVVLESSPNRHGSSNLLADHFIRGAPGGRPHRGSPGRGPRQPPPLLAAASTAATRAPASRRTTWRTFRPKILAADMVVFVTPLYYFGMSAQLKILIDRFCAFNSSLNRRHLKSRPAGLRLEPGPLDLRRPWSTTTRPWSAT